MPTHRLALMAAITLLVVLLLCAVRADLSSRRVPNRLVLAGLVLAVLSHAWALGSGSSPLAGPAWWSPLLGLLAGLAVFLPLYLLRAMGAGDVKLMAMVGAFLGTPAVFDATLYTLLAGGLLALVFMLGRGVALQTLGNVRFLLTDLLLRLRNGQGARLAPLETTAARLPYALAIGLGTVAALRWPMAAA